MSSAETRHQSNELGTLPRWDLKDLYSSPKAPELKSDLASARTRAKKFCESYENKLSGLTGKELGEAIQTFESIDETLTKIVSYAQLKQAEKVDDPIIGQFYQQMQEEVTDISSLLIFFRLELNKIDDKTLAQQLEDPVAARYKPWIESQRLFRHHLLDDTMEKFLLEKWVSGKAAWVRLFDETYARMRFPMDGVDYTSEEITEKLMDSDRTVRQRAGETFGKILGQNIHLFSLITNTLARDKSTEDKWRRYQKPISARNLANQVDDSVVEALVHSVKSAYPRLSHRYYTLKAKWMGLPKMQYWDRNAPLPFEEDGKIPYPKAKEIVLSAYSEFSPRLGDVAKLFFDHPWIDVPHVAGKSPGAFAHPTVPSAHPYLLLNYQGRKRDVMTLAHELGHGVHQYLAGLAQGHLLSDTPLTLAETASVFGEMLTFRKMLSLEKAPLARKSMLAKKVEDMLNTVVRQIAFHEYETQLHARRKEGELTADEISAIWIDVQTKSLGPAFEFQDEYKYFWAYIPHFIHSPFYVYAYAFGDCLVNSLYAVYETADETFAEKYLSLLSQGGSKRHRELLAPFGLDASEPDFWDKGLGMIARFIDELETL